MTSRRSLLKSALAAPLTYAADVARTTAPPISPEDDAFLDELEKASFLFFWEQGSPATGLVKDRCNTSVAQDKGIVASIAATGFGLTALCIGHKRGYGPPDAACCGSSPASSSCGRKCPPIAAFSFTWPISTPASESGTRKSPPSTPRFCCAASLPAANIFSIGNHQSRQRHFESGRLDLGRRGHLAALPRLDARRWFPAVPLGYYSELMMMYLLGLGSPTHPLPRRRWNAWKRTTFEYDGMRYIGSYAPLFVHQYSQAWFDFRGKRDQYADYFKNSVISTEVHRRFCLELNSRFPDYTDDLWGITASDSQHGYVIWGGPPEMGPIDGTVVPSAAGGSLPFLPDATLRVLKNIKNRFAPRTWSRYGFVNAFNPLKNWYDTDVIGIDTGMTMVMAENLRSSLVWDTFMKSREVQHGLQRAGFKNYS